MNGGKKMKWKRIFSLLLVLCLILQVPIPAKAETNAVYLPKGDIDVFVLFQYELKQKQNDIKVSLFSEGNTLLDAVSLYDLENVKDFNIAVSLTDSFENPAAQDDFYSAATISIKQIPTGIYSLKLSGDGYKTYETTIVLQNYSQCLIVSNSNNTFTAGDLNEDGTVNEEDLVLFKEALSNSSSDSYDLNRDGVLNIIDYAYLYNNMSIQDSVEDDTILKNTNLIPDSVIDMEAAANQLTESYGITKEEVNHLFSVNSDTSSEIVTLKQDTTITKDNPIQIEVPFIPISKEGEEKETAPELQYVTMTVPTNDDNTPSEGVVIFEVVGEDGTITKEEVPFSDKKDFSIVPQKANELRLFSEPEQQRKIVIDLGKRVAVKKVIIKITKTAKDTSLASIAKVEFLQEMISTPQEETNRIKNVKVQAGDKSVTLKWDSLSNVTGYLVKYGTSSGNYEAEYPATSNSCTIEGLENDTLYYFVVYGKNGDWFGSPSAEVSCMPFSKEPPGIIGGVNIKPMDEALQISWGADKYATSYNLYYKEADADTYNEITDIPTASYYLAGLTNDIEYYIMVCGVNEYGIGGKSPLASGTPIKIVIEEPEGIPTYNLIDNSHIESIRLTHKDHYNTTYYPNGVDPMAVIDNDYTTSWIARNNWWENQGFVVTFDQAYEMNHVVWVTRLDDTKFMSTINRYYIEVWEEGDDLSKAGTVLIPYGTFLAKNPLSSKGVEILTFPKSRVKQIKVSTKMKDGGPAPHSASELRFHTYYSLVDEIEALFADTLHTKLASNVTAEMIEEYKLRLSGSTGEFYVDKEVLLKELEIAESLLPGNTPLSNIIEAEVGRNASKDTDRKFAYTLNDLQPIGISASTNQNIIIYAQPDEDGVLPTLVMTQHAGEAANWNRSVALQEGRNIITIPKFDSRASEQGGSLYIKYTGKGGAKLNVFGGTKIPLLNLPDFSFETLTFNGTTVTDSNEVQNKAAIETYLKELKLLSDALGNPAAAKLQTMVANATEIATKHVLLSIPARVVYQAVSQNGTRSLEEQVEVLYQTLAAWEKNMLIHYTVCGLSSDAPETKNQYPSSRINIRYMTITGKAFMYAGGAHIGIGYGSGGGMVNAPLSKATNGLFGWGINHEIGHVLDQGGLTKPETTNNIHSLFSQTFDGVNNTGTSRLEGGIYENVFQKTAYGAPGISNNVFVQLAMYWQLHLTYDSIGEDSYDFYSKLYQLARSNTVKADNADMLFVKLACDTAQKDLTEFFTRWGYVLTPDTIDYIKNKNYSVETRPIYYGNDSVKRYEIAGGNSVLNADTDLVVNAEQITEANGSTSVNLSITLPDGVDKNAILGYEIKRNGKVLTFITPKLSEETNQFEQTISYKDENITINNSVIEYSITAYDLTYSSCTKTSGKFKLNYDGTMDNTNWTYSISEDKTTVTIELETEQDISGIKVYTGEDSKIVIPVTKDALVSSDLTETKVSDTISSDLVKAEVSDVTGSALNGFVVIGDENIPVTLTSVSDKDGFTTYYFSFSNDPEDGRIQTYTTKKFSIQFEEIGYTTEELKEKLLALRYPGDNIEFYHPQEQASIGILGEDYYYDGGMIAKDSIIVVGTFRGDPVYNVVMLKGTYSSTSEEGDDTAEDILEEQIIEGEQLLFAVLPENKVMTNISNGMWIYMPDFSENTKLPDTIYAEFYRVDNPDTLEGQRLVSNTVSIPVPSKETLPIIYLTGNTNN